MTITPTSLDDHQIFQRDSEGARANVRVDGTLTGASLPVAGSPVGIGIQYRIVDHGGTGAGVEWLYPKKVTITPVPVTSPPTTSTTFSLWFDLPVSSGWKNIQIRTIDHLRAEIESYEPSSSQIRFLAGSIIVFLGQSNAVRMFSLPDTASPPLAAAAGTAEYVADASPPVLWNPPTGKGIVTMLNRLRALLGHGVGAINLGVDSTALVAESDWLAAGHWWDTAGAQLIYQVALATFKNATAHNLSSATGDVHGQIEGIVWMQGEAEGSGATPPLNIFVKIKRYRDALNRFIAQCRGQNGSIEGFGHWRGQSELPFAICNLPVLKQVLNPPYAGGLKMIYPQIRSALALVAERDQRNSFIVDSYDAAMGSDGLHYTPDGAATVGDRLAFAWHRFLVEGSTSPIRGPRIVSTKFLGNTTIQLTVEHDQGTDLVVPAGAEYMFDVLAEHEFIRVTSVTKVGTNKLNLELSRSVNRNKLLLKYAGQSFVDASWVITDNSSPPVPMQMPFSPWDGSDGVIDAHGLRELREWWTDTLDKDANGGTLLGSPPTGGTITYSTDPLSAHIQVGARIEIARSNAFWHGGVVTAIRLNTGGNDEIDFEPAPPATPASGDDLRVNCGTVTGELERRGVQFGAGIVVQKAHPVGL